MSSILESLPPRPPTPPRETHHEAAVQSNHVLAIASAESTPSVHTPPGISSPHSTAATNSTSRRRKKVGFSAKAEYKDPPVYPEGVARRQHPTPVSLPRSASKPVKSILKVTHHEANPLEATNEDGCDPCNPLPNLATMLESTIQQLAGGDRDAKLDAYMMLTRAWRASNNLPDRVALQDKMGLFMQFMQRDLVCKTPEGTVDTSLVNHTLNLLITFLGFPAIASTITNDFGVFIIDHCIRSFEDASVPKDVARHLMKVISIQNFSAKVMTSDRVGRLVTSLHNIEEHLQGKSIVMSRVLIYKKLVKQARPLMVAHSDWLFDLFTDMLSTLKDIRSSAIALGFEAAFSIGHEKQLSRKVMEIFKSATSEDGQQYVEYYEDRLEAMAKEKQDSAAIPRIWSVVILLIRFRLGEWEFSSRWLKIIQDCFNSSDIPTKVEANYAWNCLVYQTQTDERLFTKHLSKLAMPLTSQLKRRGNKKNAEDIRKAVFSGICNLFYYTFKPSMNPTLLDSYWDISLKPVITKLLDTASAPAQDHLDQASAILTGLFDCTTPRRWRDDRVVERSPVKPEELPAIDSKWIRRSAGTVFGVVQPILERDFLALAEENSATHKLWQTLVATVASAALKEIKVAKDTAVFVTEALQVLQTVWKRGLPVDENAPPGAVKFLLAVRAFLEVMIRSLDLLPFTEKPGKGQTFAKAPLYQLFSMLSALPPGVPDDGDFAGFFASVFHPFFAPKGDKAQMDLAQDLLTTIPMEAPRPYGPWAFVAGRIMTWLEPSPSGHHSTGSGNETPVGHDYRDIVKVLERGIRSTPNLPWDHWEALFYALYERARDETGDAGVAIAVIEPLAKVLLDQLTQQGSTVPSANTLRCLTELLAVATQPRDKQAVEAARRRLWGTVYAGSRSSAFDPFDNLYKAATEALGYLYQQFDASNSDAAADLLKEVGGFFDRCNRQLFFKTMSALQDGFLPWLHDAKRLLGSQTGAVFIVTKSLWDKLSTLIADAERSDLQLESVERLFCATFNSSHRSIVNSSVALWNRLFGNAENLEYPEKLKAALIQVQPHADIEVPGLEISSGEYAGQQPLFVDSLDDYSLPKLYTRSSRRGTPLAVVAPRSESPRSSKLGSSARRHLDATPKAKSTRDTRRSTTPRLRHDDSQVQFAAIEPSPLDSKNMESQVFTERQKEVRERQKENTALFPEIRSSPGPKSKESTRVVPFREPSPEQEHHPQVRAAATPEPENGYNDYVSSTPTPRRGQPVFIPEHDMMDPPSSPPEPRRNPLAAEIRSRSASNSLLDDWQFTSSPISGSPNPSRHTANPEVAGQNDLMGDVTMSDAEDDLPPPHDDAVTAVEEPEPEPVPENDLVEDSVVTGRDAMPTIVSLDPIETPVSTPSKNTRSAARQETPKSDSDVFVDAPTSPLPPTPRRVTRSTRASSAAITEAPPMPALAPANSLSFDINDVDETSLLRVVVELESGKFDRSEYVRPSASPEKNKLDNDAVHPTAGKVETQDCIVVVSPRRPASQGLTRWTRSDSVSSTILTSSAVADTEQIPSSQLKGRGRRGKRKRGFSKGHEAAGKKRKEHGPDSEVAEVPDSQPGEKTEAAVKADKVPEERSLSPSAEYFSQDSFSNSDQSSQESAVLVDLQSSGNIHMESDDHDVQSQIALESQQGQSECAEQDANQPAPLVTSMEEHADESIMQIDDDDSKAVVEATPDQIDVDPQSNEKAKEVPEEDIINNDSVLKEEHERQPEPDLDPVQKIMSIFRGGLDMLRSASLSRTEVYQIEDMLMDTKRELYDAERRGRGGE
ncbi:Rap1-interacting factor 1 N terminal-domain-containing protein [Apodospora peruviana]|uniref:Rap1-interacting factor 1 N terminal-domain-containing protein n=1 Tax=Apodospora peruviana TaxID=516989 RepID=A0AAE0IRS6_9PEZI|nr:Rap1-interacting factor 1 N terminal-domain-containing protein [Apodospora peruviana]